MLYEDIEQWLINCRDSESIMKVIDLVLEEGVGVMGVGDKREKRGGGFEEGLMGRCSRGLLEGVKGYVGSVNKRG